MNYLLLDQSEVNRRYNEKLQEAEQERRYRRLQAKRPNLQTRSLLALAGALINAGQKLKEQSGNDAAIPA